MTKQTKDAVETGIEAGKAAAEQIKTAFEATNERAKTAMEKSTKIVEELAELTRGNVEAIVASSKVAAKGVEGLSQDAANFSRKSFEDASAALQELHGHQVGDRFLQAPGRFRPQRVRCRRRPERPRQRDRAEAGRRRRRAADQPLHCGGRACEDPGCVTRQRRIQ